MKSESNPLWIVVASFGAGFLLCLIGAAVVFAFYEPDYEEEILVALEESVDAVMPERTPSEAPAVVEAAGDEASCEETLAMVRQAHAEAIEEFSANEELVDYLSDLVERSGAASRHGTPMNFPEQLDEQFRPENFEGAVEELMADCPELFPEGTSFDCSEYPCVIEAPAEEMPEFGREQFMAIQEGCPALGRVLGRTGYMMSPMSVEDQHFMRFTARGTGIGLRDHLDNHRGNFQRRSQYRNSARRQEIVAEIYQEACLLERDGEACRHMAWSFMNDRDERMSYYQMGCDANDANSCHAFGRTRCISMGRCDGLALSQVERAIELAPDAGAYYETLATILCQMGQSRAADTARRHGCDLGHEESCGRSC